MIFNFFSHNPILVTSRATNHGGGNHDKVSFILKHPDLYEVQSHFRDSCKVAVFLSNELQTANVAYKGSLYGENLSTVKERKVSRFGFFLSSMAQVVD